MISRVSALFRAIFFPPRCAGCRMLLAAGTLCDTCRKKIVIYRTLFCGECGERLFGAKMLCHPDFFYVQGAATTYADPRIQALVQMLKFGRNREAAEPLVALIKEYLLSVGDIFKDCTVVPIPLSRKRLRMRGFNQAEIIAQPLARHLGLTFDTATLVRIRHAKPQTETRSAAERRENLRGCFAVRNVFVVRGRDILLVDDVTTTGATFLEAAKVLKAAGARTIYALSAARA
jgi:ComF family protein